MAGIARSLGEGVRAFLHGLRAGVTIRHGGRLDPATRRATAPRPDPRTLPRQRGG
jgi:hypothetical protein